MPVQAISNHQYREHKTRIIYPPPVYQFLVVVPKVGIVYRAMQHAYQACTYKKELKMQKQFSSAIREYFEKRVEEMRHVWNIIDD